MLIVKIFRLLVFDKLRHVILLYVNFTILLIYTFIIIFYLIICIYYFMWNIKRGAHSLPQGSLRIPSLCAFCDYQKRYAHHKAEDPRKVEVKYQACNQDKHSNYEQKLFLQHHACCKAAERTLEDESPEWFGSNHAACRHDFHTNNPDDAPSSP